MIINCKSAKNLERGSYLFQGTILAFAWGDCRKPQHISVRTVSSLSEFWTG